MTFEIPQAYKNNTIGRTNNELTMIDDSDFGILDGTHSDSVTTITCQSGFRLTLVLLDGPPMAKRSFRTDLETAR